MVVFDFDPPQMGDNPDAATRYLYRLVEQLKYTLGQIDGSQESQEYRTVIARLSETIEDIKSLRNAVNAISERDIDYTDTVNKPRINGVELAGNLDADDLGIVAAVAGKELSTNDYTDEDKAKVASAIDSNEKGAANGVCPLDAMGKVDGAYLPSMITFTTETVIESYSGLPSGEAATRTAQLTAQPVGVLGITTDNPDVAVTSFAVSNGTLSFDYKNTGLTAATGNIEVTICYAGGQNE